MNRQYYRKLICISLNVALIVAMMLLTACTSETPEQKQERRLVESHEKLQELIADYPLIYDPFAPEPAPEGFALIGSALIDTMDAKNMFGLEDYLRLGGIFLASKDFTRAAQFFELANDSAVVRDDPRLLGANFSNTGVVFTMGPVKERGFDFLIDALAIHRSLNDREACAHNMRVLAALFADKISLDTAEAFIRESIAIDRELGQTKFVAADLAKLGFLQGHQERFEEARQNHTEALVIYRELEDTQGTASQLINVGRTFRKLGLVDSARVYLDEAFALATEHALRMQLKTSERELQELDLMQ